MSPLFSRGSQSSDDTYLPIVLGILVNIGKRLGFIVVGALTGLAIWLGGHARTDKTADATVPPEQRKDDAFDQRRNLHGRVVIIAPTLQDQENPMIVLEHALELLRLDSESATPPKITELLGIPVEKVTPDRPLLELLIGEIDPALKAELIAELGTESATAGQIQGAARSLGIEGKKLFILSRSVPVTFPMLQQGSQDPEVAVLLDTAKAYAWSVVPGHNRPLPENHTAKLGVPFPGRPSYAEVNARTLSPRSLPPRVGEEEVRP
jgi:hypothetical protein